MLISHRSLSASCTPGLAGSFAPMAQLALQPRSQSALGHKDMNAWHIRTRGHCVLLDGLQKMGRRVVVPSGSDGVTVAITGPQCFHVCFGCDPVNSTFSSSRPHV